MKRFLKENMIFLAVILGFLIIAVAVYFSSGKNQSPPANFLTPSPSTCSLPNLPDNSERLATKIIDGDTFLIEGGLSVRILGIDADERGYPCYQPAKERLEKLILNKNIKLEKATEDHDQFCRYLRFVFLGEENIGQKLVEEGLAVARSSSEKYREAIARAEKKAKEGKIGCKWGINFFKIQG